jgi:hypothetical protein
MRQADIVYLYEHASRELDVACAVTARLRRDFGLSVEIVHWPQGFGDAVATIQPRLVILPFCYSERSYTNLLHFWNEAIFFNLTWEQLFYPGNQKAKTPRGAFAIEHVIHHAWSNAYAEFLGAQGIPADHIVRNGQPAYTLYDEPYRRYFATREALARRYDIDPQKRWIFFPENYNWAFYSDATLARFLADGQSQLEITEMRDFCNRSLNDVLEWCRAAALDGHVEIILRPRPSTPLASFREVVQHSLLDIPAGLHILDNESVREWILASDAVVSSHSTSLIESAIARKRIYILEPFPIPAPLKAEWHSCVPRIKTEEAFLSMCREDTLDQEEHALESWARQRLMSNGDAIKNLAVYMNDLVSGKGARPAAYKNRGFLTPAKRILPKRLWALYRQKEWQSKPIAPIYVKEVLTPVEMEERIAKWEEILP